MPIHDWTRAPTGVFHQVHNAWITAPVKRMNKGLLPPHLDAMGEQKFPGAEPDVLSLQDLDRPVPPDWPIGEEGGGGVASLATKPPAVAAVDTAEELRWFDTREDQVVVRRVNGDDVVAVAEIVSEGKKSGRDRFGRFLTKNADHLAAGIHLLLVDLHPPGRTDPAGLHAAFWEFVTGDQPAAPGVAADAPLMQFSYRAGRPLNAFLQPAAPGDDLARMPLFLSAEAYLETPLPEGYADAVDTLPEKRVRRLTA